MDVLSIEHRRMTKVASQIVDQIVTALSKGQQNTPAIRAVRKQVSKQIASFDRAVVLDVAHQLIRRASYGRFVAYELVHYHAPTMQALDIAEVEALGAGMSSWAEVDTFSIEVAGPAWRGDRISGDGIAAWAASNDRWWRRAALVSTVPLHSAAQTLAICELLLNDRDDMVVKAMSWALRALVKYHPKKVEQFVSHQRRQLAPRVIREVGNKLTTGLKNPKKVTQKVTQ